MHPKSLTYNAGLSWMPSDGEVIANMMGGSMQGETEEKKGEEGTISATAVFVIGCEYVRWS